MEEETEKTYIDEAIKEGKVNYQREYEPKMEEEFEKLIKLTEPLRNYISEKYDMKVSILVNCDEVKVIRDEVGVPIKKEDKIKIIYGNDTENAIEILNKIETEQKLLELFRTKEIEKLEITYKKESALKADSNY
jgi:hypothetical protein